MRRHFITGVNALAVFAVLVGLWQALVWISGIPAYVLPGPLEVVKAIGDRHAALRRLRRPEASRSALLRASELRWFLRNGPG